jgi:predicted dehydrogenase
MRIAVLGLGFMGSTHVKSLRSVAGAELAAVYSSDERKLTGDLTSVAGNIGGPGETLDFSRLKKYRDIPTLLADPEIDAVDICLPTDLHAPVAIDALRAGKHVLVEKPMALDGASADRMVDEAARCGRVLMAAQVIRFWPEYAALRAGTVRSVVFRRQCAAPTWGGWLRDPARSGGGAFDLLIHDADFCLHLFGKPQAVSATGWDETLRANLFYADGTVAAIEGGWYPGAIPFSMSFTAVGERDTIEYRLGSDAPDAYAAELQYFVDCCRAGCQPELCPPRESADAVKLMLLLLEARKRNGEKLPCTI